MDAYILHNANSLLSLANKLILSLLNHLPILLVQVINFTPGRALGSLCRIQHQSRVLDILPRLGREHQVRVQSRVPPRKEPALDLRILRQSRLANLLRRKRILLEPSCERVLVAIGVCLGQEVRTGEGCAGDRVVEGLGLGFRCWGSGQGSLGFRGGGRVREELDFLADGAAQVVEGFADVRGVVVGFVGVLGSV